MTSLWTHSQGGRELARLTLEPPPPETPAQPLQGPAQGTVGLRSSSRTEGGGAAGAQRPQLAWGSEPRGLLAWLWGHVLTWGITSARARPRGTWREPAPGLPTGPCPLKRPVLLWNVLLVRPGPLGLQPHPADQSVAAPACTLQPGAAGTHGRSPILVDSEDRRAGGGSGTARLG